MCFLASALKIACRGAFFGILRDLQETSNSFTASKMLTNDKQRSGVEGWSVRALNVAELLACSA